MFTFLFWVQLSLALVEDRNITEMRKAKQALGVFTVVRVIFYQVIFGGVMSNDKLNISESIWNPGNERAHHR